HHGEGFGRPPGRVGRQRAPAAPPAPSATRPSAPAGGAFTSVRLARRRRPPSEGDTGHIRPRGAPNRPETAPQPALIPVCGRSCLIMRHAGDTRTLLSLPSGP